MPKLIYPCSSIKQIIFKLVKKFLIISFVLFSVNSKTAFALDMTNGAWKNLNDRYDQSMGSDEVFSGFINSRLYYNDTYQSNKRASEFKETFVASRMGLGLQLYPNLFLKSVLILEKMPQASETARRSQLPSGGGDRSFENEGAFLDELVLNYNYKRFSVLAGKFTPNFGDAWRRSNGIWVNELARTYEYDEKLGAGVIQRAGNKNTIGEYVFGFSAFTNDRKNFDNSIITKRDSESKSDGVVGDTRSLQSYVASMDIFYEFAGEKKSEEKLSYHFAYSNLAVNERQNTSNIPAFLGDQKSVAVNMHYEHPFSDNFLLDSLVEYVNIKNLDGNILASENLLTINLTGYVYSDVYLTLARATDQRKEFGTNGLDSYINEISLGYKLEKLHPTLKYSTISVGYNQRQIDDKIDPINSRAWGLMIKHKIDF